MKLALECKLFPVENTRTSIQPDRPRPLILFVSWMALTSVATVVGWSINDAWFPWEIIDPEDETFAVVAILLSYITPGIFLAAAQYAVFRYHMPGSNWLLWLAVTPVAYAAARTLSAMMWNSWLLNEANPWTEIEFICYHATIGVLMGLAQAPILDRWFGGHRGWYWPLPCAVGSTLAGLLAATFSTLFANITLVTCLSGATYGLVTGLGLILLLRAEVVPQEKEEAQAS